MLFSEDKLSNVWQQIERQRTKIVYGYQYIHSFIMLLFIPYGIFSMLELQPIFQYGVYAILSISVAPYETFFFCRIQNDNVGLCSANNFHQRIYNSSGCRHNFSLRFSVTYSNTHLIEQRFMQPHKFALQICYKPWNEFKLRFIKTNVDSSLDVMVM